MRNECRDVPKDRELENYCRIVANERTVIPENISYVLEYVTTQNGGCSGNSGNNRPRQFGFDF